MSSWTAPLLVLLGFFLSGHLVFAQDAPESQTILKYLGNRASAMAGALPKRPTTRPAWDSRRNQVRSALTNVLGLPEREPMRGQVVKMVEDDDLIIEDVIYLWAERAYVTGNVARPKEVDEKLPAIVSPPGWLGRLDQPYYKPWACHMARNGYLVLFIDDPRVGKRQAGYSGFYGIASAAGTQAMGVQVFDTLRGLDYLTTRDDVDQGRIGICGLCQGSEQTWLAAALEDRFRVVSPVCGTTTYQWWARMPAFLGVGLSDPSPWVGDILRHTDWDETNACIAPRPVLIASNSGDNWWPKPGFDKVVRTLEQTYALYEAKERFKVVWDLRSHSMTPFIHDIQPWFDQHLKPLAKSDAVPAPISPTVDADANMIRYFQRRIASQAAKLPTKFDSPGAWSAYRQDIVSWLEKACSVDELNHGQPRVASRNEQGAVVVEVVHLPQDKSFSCPALLYRSTENAGKALPALLLSHHSHGCAKDPSVAKIAKILAEDGFTVMVPEHASTNNSSHRRTSSQQQGANFISLYGVGDTVGLPPLAQRVWDDLACVEYLSKRDDLDQPTILVAGMGVGGVDAALCAVLDNRVAGAALIGVITVQDWAQEVAPIMHQFDRIMPYLPSIVKKTDLQYFYAAVAPRPLLLVDATDREHWPETGFQRAKMMASHVYDLLEANNRISAMPAKSSWGLQELRMWAIAAASDGREE